MEASFPECERPDPEAQRKRIDNNPRMHCCAIEHPDHIEPVGLLTYWELDGMLYIEHFAIHPNLRGKGYGEQALALFLKISDAQTLPVVLEVEQPNDSLSRRRIDFYRRNGLVLWSDLGYIQPPYRTGGESVPMLIMSTPSLDPSNFSTLRDNLYRHVYNCHTIG